MKKINATVTCPDCSQPFKLKGEDGGVCCLSYLHADGRIRLATTHSESVAIYRAVLDETRALVTASAAYRQANG